MSKPERLDAIGAVAIIGLAGRFPGARDVRAFWENLRAGVESISHFSDEELAGWGIDVAACRRDGSFVPARGILPDLKTFDAGFFGIHRVEAEVMDPQQRLFLESAWEALEDAGYDPETYRGSIGVYGGGSRNAYFAHNLLDRPDVLARAGLTRVAIGNEKDYLTTRVSYKLNLRGPSINVANTCATSLVAVCLAHQALVNFQCDMALAGGVSAGLPQHRWYRWEDGGVASPDGRCRAFDARGQGTVFSDGVGIVVLKRLADALADRDTIHAVILGAALNNDGSAKVGFAAPSVDGQAQVIAMAQAEAEVEPDSVTYVEAHGTATQLGDPIEVAALTQAFRARTDATGFCAIGSVKTNLGHLDAAAGVAGLIKTVLALEHAELPPSLNFTEPNPKIDFSDSPFYVNTKLSRWEAGPRPRRAGVSSFGTGSTNAHVVLEEAPAVEPSGPSRPRQLLLVSARSDAALDRITAAVAAHLRRQPELPLADVAYTLQVGRRAFSHRRMLVCRDVADAVAGLETPGARRMKSSVVGADPRVAFMFPGQGAQHVGMGHGLYVGEPVFREHLDRCAAVLEPELGLDLRSVLYPEDGRRVDAEERLVQTRITQPALFVVEYALAQLFVSWGIRPAAMIGHSVGEYVAACLAGVFTLPDALRLVAARARLMQEQPPGAMLAVKLPAADVERLLGDELSLASVNGPAQCVVAGPAEDIEAFAVLMAERGVASRRLQTSHAFHSRMMEPVVERFTALIVQARPAAPNTAWVSSLTGEWITGAQATDPSYWGRQLREPVQFSTGVSRLLADRGHILLEVGPGHALSGFAKQHLGHDGRPPVTVTALPAAGAAGGELEEALDALGFLWLNGVAPDWAGFWDQERRRRVPMPTYPFEREEFWVDPPVAATPAGPVESVPTCLTHSPCPVDPGALVAAAHREEDPAMPDSTTAVAPSSARRQGIAESLQRMLEELSGMNVPDSDRSTPLIELGFDSLVLTQVSLAIEKKFGVKASFRALLEEMSTVEALAAHIDAALPPEPVSAPAQRETPAPDFAMSTVAPTGDSRPVAPDIARRPVDGGDDRAAAAPATAVERIMAEQLRIMAQQLDILRGHVSSAVAAMPTPGAGSDSGAVGVPGDGLVRPAPPVAQTNGAATPARAGGSPPRFGPFKPIQKGPHGGLTPDQQAYLEALIGRYTKRTAKSKALTARYRSQLADPRTVSGFKMLWKEMVYPIAAVRSEGSRIWDVDGNEYVDLVMGFGANFLGHRPPCVTAALEEQLRLGFEIGPQSTLAGQVAELICELTGTERVAFCNTGSEAVMAGVRAARTATGRDRIAFFSGDYHGNYDEVLARGAAQGSPRAIPIAPGVPANLLANVTVLEYGSNASIEFLRQHGREFAAVLVEPIQGRAPGVSPREFLRELRAVTEQTETALLFDEIVTGFRVHQRGAQGLFGVDADLVTYGKVIGGGVPIGILAGRRRYMDVLDGGDWRFGDDSSPEVGVTFFAGTFVRHPLALAAAAAVLRHLKEKGPALQDDLNERTGRFVQALNDHFHAVEAPLKAQHFNPGSWFYIEGPADLPMAALLFYHLRERGVHLYEGRTALFSTAHTDDDMAFILDAFKESVAEMQRGGVLPGRTPVPAPIPNARLGKDLAGRPAWFVPDPARPGKYLQVEVA